MTLVPQVPDFLHPPFPIRPCHSTLALPNHLCLVIASLLPLLLPLAIGVPVTDDYPEGEKNKFKGVINWVRIDLEEDDVSHFEPEEQKYYRIIARQ